MGQRLGHAVARDHFDSRAHRERPDPVEACCELGLGGAPNDLRLAKHFYTLAAAQGQPHALKRLSELPEDDPAEPEHEPPAATAHEFDVERRRLNAEAEAALRAMRGMTIGQQDTGRVSGRKRDQ